MVIQLMLIMKLSERKGENHYSFYYYTITTNPRTRHASNHSREDTGERKKERMKENERKRESVRERDRERTEIAIIRHENKESNRYTV